MGVAPVLLVMGTGSGCGKSLLVAALCRIYADRGLRVAPFKAWNMSLNSAVTRDGREIARAQWLQAFAARAEPRAEMNPLLLKPKGESASQVMVLGRPYADLKVREYLRRSRYFRSIVASSLTALRQDYDLVIAEGAGSPAEVNLQRYDLANLATAELGDATVLLVADISPGGAFAAFVGHLSLLPASTRKRVRGFVVNKFRGSRDILEPGLRWLERRTKRPVIGVLPFVEDLGLPQEDSLWEWRIRGRRPSLVLGVVRLPHLSNSTDFEAFRHDDVEIVFAHRPEELGPVDALFLPGTKNTVEDLLFLRSNGWAVSIEALCAAGVPIVGICGGYQILGQEIRDPDRIESGHGSVAGLGILPVLTEFQGYQKVLRNVDGRVRGGWFLDAARGAKITGYEIRMGSVKRLGGVIPVTLSLAGKQVPEGCVRGHVLGVSLHGFFDNPDVRNSFLNHLRRRRGLTPHRTRDASLDTAVARWAATVEHHLDVELVDRWIGIRGG